MQTAAELPYFEGDFWPNVLEESIKELEQEEAEKRKREEAEAAATEQEETLPESVEGPEGANGKKKGQKSGRNKKANKSKMQRKNNKKTNMPQGTSDLAQKLFQTMEKHKEVGKAYCSLSVPLFRVGLSHKGGGGYCNLGMKHWTI